MHRADSGGIRRRPGCYTPRSAAPPWPLTGRPLGPLRNHPSNSARALRRNSTRCNGRRPQPLSGTIPRPIYIPSFSKTSVLVESMVGNNENPAAPLGCTVDVFRRRWPPASREHSFQWHLRVPPDAGFETQPPWAPAPDFTNCSTCQARCSCSAARSSSAPTSRNSGPFL